MRKRVTLVMLSVMVMVATAHAKGAGKPRGGPPVGVLAVVARGTEPGRAGWLDYANAVRPGTGMALTDPLVTMLLASSIGLRTLDGLDASQPEYLLWVDDGTQRGPVVVGAIADDAKLAHEVGTLHVARVRGHAAIGARPLVEHAAPWALSALVRQPAPTRPVAIVYMPNVLTRYKAELATARSKLTLSALAPTGPAAQIQGAFTSMAGQIMDAGMTIAGEIDQLEVSVDADPLAATLDIAIVPRPRSNLAALVAAQRPSSFGLLARLPAGTPAMVIAGELHGGPYTQYLGAMLARLYSGGDSQALIEPSKDLMAALSGEFAATTSALGVSATQEMVQVAGVADAAAAGRAYSRMLAAMTPPLAIEMFGMKATLKVGPTVVHHGAALPSFDTVIDLSTMTPAQRTAIQKAMPGAQQRAYTGLVGGFGLTVTGNAPSRPLIESVIDAALGKTAGLVLPQASADLVAGATARHASAIMLFDLSTVPNLKASGPQPMLLEVGFDTRLHLRTTMLSATFRALSNVP